MSETRELERKTEPVRAAIKLSQPGRLFWGRQVERQSFGRKAATAVKRTLAAVIAILALLLIPWEACFGAELGAQAGEAVSGPAQWVTSTMRAEELSVVLPESAFGDQAQPGTAAAASGEAAAASGRTAAEQIAAERAALHLTAVNLPETKQRPGSLEISLQAAAGSSFKTAGILLEYDYSKIRPIAWDKAQTRIEVPDIAGTAMETDLEAAWRNAAILETKSPGESSAKPALSLRNGNRAYLYLAAERQRGGPLAKDTLMVTARFAYAQGAAPSKDYVASALNFVENRAGMKVAFASPVKGSVLYQSEDAETGESHFYYYKPLEKTETGLVREDESMPADQKLDSSIRIFTYVEAGRSVGERAAETKDFVSLTFYDWDDTLLGTRIVAKEEGWLIDPNLPENRPDYVNADGTAKYTDEELAAMNVAPLAPEGNGLSGGLDQNGVTVTAINKAGYSYAGWVDYSGTSTPDVSIQAAAGQTITGNGQELVELSNLTESRVLRAAYDEAFDKSFTSVQESEILYYNITHSKFSEKDEFSITTTLTISRTAASRRSENGMVLILILRPYGLGESRLKIELGNTDIESYELILPINASEKYSLRNAVSCMLQNRKNDVLSWPENIEAAEMRLTEK